MSKKYLGFLIIMLFIIANTAVAFTTVSPENELRVFEKNSIEITLSATDYQFVIDDGTFEIEMSGFGALLYPDFPVLPSKKIYIGLPPGSLANSVELISYSTETIYPNGIPRVAPDVSDTSMTLYTKSQSAIIDDLVNHKCITYLGTSQLRKYSLAAVQFTPFIYDSGENKLTLYNEITLKINYEIVEKLTDSQLADDAMDSEAAELIINFEDIKELYQPTSMPENRQNYDYFIITTAATSTAINGFITWKTSIGYTVGTTTVGWIMTHHPSGDTQASIRNYLKNNYQAWGTKYVLLVGTHASIPMRTCWPDPNQHTANGWYDIPTDYYYADLTGNWDSDGDGFYGEMGQDQMDFVPEVYVGRIPSDSSATVSSITLKIQNFEQTAYSGWKKNAMLLGAVYSYANEDHSGSPRWDGADLMEQCKNNVLTGWNCYTMYEKNGLGPCTYTCSNPLANGPIITQWGGTTGWGIVDWAAHGLSTSATRKIWSSDDGDGVPEAAEMTYPIMIQSSDATSFNNNKPPIVFAASCNCAHPETSNNLGAALLTQGASAFVGATRVSWGSIGWTQPSHGGHGTICYDFNDRIANNGEECGPAMYNAKQYVFNTYPWGGWWDYSNMYNFVLYGDPSMGMNLPPSNPFQPTGPTTGQTGVQLLYSTSGVDPTGDLMKFGWDWDGDGTVDQWDDNNGNYYLPHQPASISHAWPTPGTYAVQVKAEDVYGKQSGFSLPLMVTIIGNSAPNQPQTPQGKVNGKAGVSYPYTTTATDLEGDPVKYGWDWDGDKIVDEWDDNGGAYYPPGTMITTSHSWSTQGTYTIHVMAEDIVGGQSTWSNPLTVSMPKVVLFNYRFPILQQLLTILFSLS